MNASRKCLAVIAALCIGIGAAALRAEAQSQTQTPQTTQAPSGGSTQTPAAGPDATKYTMAEYNAYQAAANEKNPQQQIKLLDDFVSKYPNSALLIYIYPLYYQAYGTLKTYPKVIEYADKVLALGDKIDAGARYQALYARAFAYNAMVADPAQAKIASDPAMAKQAQDAAAAGLKVLDELKKPDNLTADAFATQKKQIQ